MYPIHFLLLVDGCHTPLVYILTLFLLRFPILNQEKFLNIISIPVIVIPTNLKLHTAELVKFRVSTVPVLYSLSSSVTISDSYGYSIEQVVGVL